LTYLARPNFWNFIANGIVVHNCGKTLEVINLALYRKNTENYKHCLVICCVNSAKFSWQEDIDKHTNGSEYGYILGTRKKRNGKLTYGGCKERLEDLQIGHMYGDVNSPQLPYFIITNIETLRMKSGKKYPITEEIIKLINKGEINIVPIDEVHKNMSPTSAQGKCILTVKKHTADRAEWIPMTGTPIVNRPTDVFTPLKLVDGHTFASFYRDWLPYFCISSGYGATDVICYKHIPELKNMLQGNMLRRLKSEVLDLPDKAYYTEYIENTKYQQGLYKLVKNDLLGREDDVVSSLNPLAMMLRLRQVNGSPELVDSELQVDGKYITKNAKLQRLMEILEDIHERGEKVIIFSNWVEPLKTVYKYVSVKYKTCCFTGKMSEEEREKHKRVFINNPSYTVMLGTIGAMGVNHSFPGVKNTIFYDNPWSSADRKQAEDRTSGVGRGVNGESSIYYTLIVKDTIDETVHNILKDKQITADYLVDGDELNLRKNPELLRKLLS